MIGQHNWLIGSPWTFDKHAYLVVQLQRGGLRGKLALVPPVQQPAHGASVVPLHLELIGPVFALDVGDFVSLRADADRAIVLKLRFSRFVELPDEVARSQILDG